MKKIMLTLLFLLPVLIHAQCWQSVLCGGYHTVAVKTDGTVWAWGTNMHGELGDGTQPQRQLTPVQTQNISDMRSLFVGNYNTFMIKNDGSLWAWGGGYYGLFGNGYTGNYLLPTQIGIGYQWKSIASESFHTIALREDGTLWCSGGNAYGQLGNNSDTDSYYFVQVGSDNHWDKIAIGTNYSLAIKTDGTLWSWGANYNGQLGIGSTTNAWVPTRVGTASNWVSVSAGYGHTLALKSDGSLWAWGNNTAGQLGIGGNVNVNVPMRVGNDNDWVSIDTGDYFSLAKKSNNSVWFWGSGRKVNGSFVNTYTPDLMDASLNSNTISGGYKHLAVVNSNGSLLIRGWNDWGQLGNGTTVSNYDLTELGCTDLGSSQFEAMKFSIAPIPAVEFLTIENNFNVKLKSISIFDITGKKISEQLGANTQIDIRNLERGIYFITLNYNGGKQTQKFIKQ